MLLKYSFYGLAVLAALSDAGKKKSKRKSGRRHFKRHQAHLASQPYDPERMENLDQPGAEDLYAYLESGEYEDFTAEWYEEAIEMGMLADKDRQEGGYSEAGFRNFNKNPAVMKGNHKYGNTVAYTKYYKNLRKLNIFTKSHDILNIFCLL